MTSFKVRTFLTGAGGLALILAGSAAQAEPIHVRGTVAAVDGSTITVKANNGKSVALTLNDGWRLSGVVPASMTDIKPGVFIGTANEQGPDGNTALEVVVFPEAMRGAGEGDRDWDLKPKSAMTNATVESAVTGVQGQTVTLKYKGGEKKVSIAPDTPIVTIASAGPDDIKPGVKVFVAGEPDATGTKLTKGFIAVGKNGLTPPM